MSRLKPPVRATIADVAQRAGLSTATVSRVINRTGPVSSETAQRVRQAIEELHYIPHLAARQLASQRTQMLGLVLDVISGDFFSPMLRGIERGAHEAGYDLLIATTRDGTCVIGDHNADGVLIFNDCVSDDELQRLHGAQFPAVLLYRTPPQGVSIPYIAFRNKEGARQMTDHLIERCGYRLIAFLRGPQGNQDSFWREKGFRESLAEHGIACDPVRVGLGGFNDEVAHQTVMNWLAAGIRMDAIFAADDDSAIGAMVALREAGLHIPNDIAVVGFDDIPSARHLTPSLTTVRAPIEQTGYEAARQLIRLIQEGNAEPELLLPTELIVRDSCGFARTNRA